MESIAGRATLRKVAIRLLPFLFVLYIFAYLDRTNVGMAKLQMSKLPGFSDAVYGLGAGIFFIGYFLFEVPSNLILERVGAQRWIARIMVTWGIISAAMMFADTPTRFYVLRFLLGVAEAGFFPGIILYLTYWFTARERARVVSLFMTATVAANIIGSPISGYLLTLKGMGLAGWQWLYLLEGVPSVFLGIAVLFYLPNGPKHASWLTSEERDWLLERLEKENRAKAQSHHGSLKAVFSNPAVWTLCLLYLTLVLTMYGIVLWLPQVLSDLFKATGHPISERQIGLLASLPYIAAVAGLLFIGMSSDRRHERNWHVSVSAFIGGVGVALAASTGQPYLALLGFGIAAFGAWGTLGPFWSLPTSFLSGTAAAGGIAWINSVGNLGGFLGPNIMATLKGAGSDYSFGLYALSASLFCGAVLAQFVRHRPSPHPEPATGKR